MLFQFYTILFGISIIMADRILGDRKKCIIFLLVINTY